jgi:hypothetical protein
VNTGYIKIEAPASEIIFKQEHPLDYWVARKVVGQSWKNELVLLRETFTLPIDLEIRYKADLENAPGYLTPTTEGTISGVVSLSGTPVQNSVVRCVRSSDNVAITSETTDGNGEYEFTGLGTTDTYNVFVEYESGGTKYNAKNFWSINGFIINFELASFTPPAGDSVDFALSEFGLSIPRARYLARVWTSYQGEDIDTDFAINFTPSTDWTLEELETTGLRGIVIGYTLYLEIVGYRGELFFDNIRAIHGGTNWARDPRCNEIDKTFTKAFAVVPPFWIADSLPAGASFSSEFPPAL